MFANARKWMAGKLYPSVVNKGVSDYSGSILASALAKASPPGYGVEELIQYYNKSPWVRAIVSKIADGLVSVDWRIGYIKSAKGIKMNAARSGAPLRARKGFDYLVKESTRSNQEFVELDEHLFYELIYDGNGLLPGEAVRRLMSIYYDINGEAFAWKDRANGRVVTSLYPVPNHWIRKRPKPDYPFYEIRVGSSNKEIPEDDMFVMRNPNPESPFTSGSGAGSALATEIDTDEYAAEFARAYFYNHARPDKIVSVEGATPDTAKRMQDAINQHHSGPRKAHQLRFIGGKVSAVDLTTPMDEASTIELRKFERDLLITVFGVPRELLGILDNSNRATIEAADLIMSKYVLLPRLSMQCAYYQRLVNDEYDSRLVVTFSNPVPEDLDRQLRAAEKAPHVLTQGEWRKLTGHMHRGDVDEIQFVPLNLTARKPDEVADKFGVDDKDKSIKSIVTKADQKIIDETLEQAFSDDVIDYETSAYYKGAIKEWGDRELVNMGLVPMFNLRDPYVAEWMQNYSGEHIKYIDDTTKEALRRTLAEGIANGEGYQEMTRRVRGVYADAKGYRAVAIARTESLQAASIASERSWAQSGLVAGKGWMSEKDKDVRETHIGLNGKEIPLNENFTMASGATGPRPGFMSTADENINCRCSIYAVVDLKKSIVDIGKQFKQWNENLTILERGAERRFVRAFAEQEKRVLTELRNQMF